MIVMAGSRMPDWDPVRAWRFIRASKAYRYAWRRRRPQPGLLEPGPFEIRWQTEADAGALHWGLLAWADPYADAGPASPYWAGSAMPDGRVERDAAPLAALAAADEAGLTGLRVGGDRRRARVELEGPGAGSADGGALRRGGPALPLRGGPPVTAVSVRIRDTSVGLRMLRALEVLDRVLQRLEQGELYSIDAIDQLVLKAFTDREGRPIHRERKNHLSPDPNAVLARATSVSPITATHPLSGHPTCTLAGARHQ